MNGCRRWDVDWHLHLISVLLDVDSPADNLLLVQHGLRFLLDGLLQALGQAVRGAHVVLPVKGQQLCLHLHCFPLCQLQGA